MEQILIAPTALFVHFHFSDSTIHPNPSVNRPWACPAATIVLPGLVAWHGNHGNNKTIIYTNRKYTLVVFAFEYVLEICWYL